jgi:hypothetical protein
MQDWIQSFAAFVPITYRRAELRTVGASDGQIGERRPFVCDAPLIAQTFSLLRCPAYAVTVRMTFRSPPLSMHVVCTRRVRPS